MKRSSSRSRPVRAVRSPLPVAPAGLVEVLVERLGGRGDGVALMPDGRRLYIAGTLPGERVRVRIGEARADGFAAEIVEILDRSPERVEPPCPHFGRCGGCSLQHLDPSAYLAWKIGRLTGALAKADIAGYELRPAVTIAAGERRRATLSVESRAGSGGRIALGFAETHSHAVVDLATCLVLAPRIVALLPALRALLADILAPGRRTRIAVVLLDGGLDVVLNWPKPPPPALFERLARFAHEADLARLSWRKDASAPAEPVVQRRPAQVVIAGVPVAVAPGCFLQATARGEAALVDAVLEGTEGAGAVADLFCGVGTFALPLAAAGARVHAIDADPDAVDALAAAARGNPRLATERRNLFARPLAAEELDRFDAVVLDPPRAGAREQARALAASKVPVAVCVSCNPDTFVRDAKILSGGGYRLVKLTPVDQFLWSAHLELAAVFAR
ncbi:MAG: 23S rRNA (uracil(1939)-C(5))-methyltransferase RlmD [Rhodospirillales bacterium]|nr:23S rRNA (uracil(1939)-C(5))-methyltransferase RlmD [Rhodospirillales bacterium]